MNVMDVRTDITDAKASNTGIWIFRVLVVAVAGVMLVSWFLPWWTVDIEAFGNDMVQIRPWGLVLDERMGDFKVLLKGADMPVWFAPFMWTYLGLCMIALLAGSWVRDKELDFGRFKIKLSQLLIGGVGFSYFVVGIVTAIYGSMRCRACMGVPFLGRSFINLGEPLITYIESRFLPGYYLIYVTAILLIALALLRDKICTN
jgi:hypothetical protein